LQRRARARLSDQQARAILDLRLQHQGRRTRGVIVFNTANAERVVAVERLSEEEENGEGLKNLAEKLPRPFVATIRK